MRHFCAKEKKTHISVTGRSLIPVAWKEKQPLGVVVEISPGVGGQWLTSVSENWEVDWEVQNLGFRWTLNSLWCQTRYRDSTNSTCTVPFPYPLQ